MIVIDLTADQIAACDAMGITRHNSSRKRGDADYLRSGGDPFELDQQGAMGEYAAGVYLYRQFGLEFDDRRFKLTEGTYGTEPDLRIKGHGVEVKSSRKRRLYFGPVDIYGNGSRETKDEPFLLVSPVAGGDRGRIEIVGWETVRGAVAKARENPEYITEDGKRAARGGHTTGISLPAEALQYPSGLAAFLTSCGRSYRKPSKTQVRY
jgi:hypothetical protein